MSEPSTDHQIMQKAASPGHNTNGRKNSNVPTLAIDTQNLFSSDTSFSRSAHAPTTASVPRILTIPAIDTLRSPKTTRPRLSIDTHMERNRDTWKSTTTLEAGSWHQDSTEKLARMEHTDELKGGDQASMPKSNEQVPAGRSSATPLLGINL
jgi:hypothetical protein